MPYRSIQSVFLAINLYVEIATCGATRLPTVKRRFGSADAASRDKQNNGNLGGYSWIPSSNSTDGNVEILW